MIIKKFLHSCILIESGGKRLLVDPGAFSFVEKKITPRDIGKVDAILITHKHMDHYFLEALRAFYMMQLTTIIANQEVCILLEQEGLRCEEIKENQTKNIAGFTIRALKAPHEPIPAECPHNFSFLINSSILHPGDSFQASASCQTLFLPIAGPWCRLVDAIDFAQRIKPERVIPIHDGIIKEFMLERMYEMCKNKLKPIEFHALQIGEKLEV